MYKVKATLYVILIDTCQIRYLNEVKINYMILFRSYIKLNASHINIVQNKK